MSSDGSTGISEESLAVKKICLVLALILVLVPILNGCDGGDSLPYAGPEDGADQPDDGAVTPTPPDDGGDTPTPPPPPIDDDDGDDGDDDSGLQPPAPPIL